LPLPLVRPKARTLPSVPLAVQLSARLCLVRMTALQALPLGPQQELLLLLSFARQVPTTLAFTVTSLAARSRPPASSHVKCAVPARTRAGHTAR
jgi:hypothetical protein